MKSCYSSEDRGEYIRLKSVCSLKDLPNDI